MPDIKSAKDRDYTKTKNALTLHHHADSGHQRQWEVQMGHNFDEQESKRLRTWVEQMLRLDDCAPARDLLLILNAVVYAQAVEQGYEDAMRLGSSRLHSVASGIWHDGYTEGFARGMADRYEEALPHERST
jgi:hypothetical protein